MQGRLLIVRLPARDRLGAKRQLIDLFPEPNRFAA
jgi:hypothetical protein